MCRAAEHSLWLGQGHSLEFVWFTHLFPYSFMELLSSETRQCLRIFTGTNRNLTWNGLSTFSRHVNGVLPIWVLGVIAGFHRCQHNHDLLLFINLFHDAHTVFPLQNRAVCLDSCRYQHNHDLVFFVNLFHDTHTEISLYEPNHISGFLQVPAQLWPGGIHLPVPCQCMEFSPYGPIHLSLFQQVPAQPWSGVVHLLVPWHTYGVFPLWAQLCIWVPAGTSTTMTWCYPSVCFMTHIQSFPPFDLILYLVSCRY